MKFRPFEFHLKLKTAKIRHADSGAAVVVSLIRRTFFTPAQFYTNLIYFNKNLEILINNDFMSFLQISRKLNDLNKNDQHVFNLE